MSDSVNPRKYTKEDKGKMANIPGTSYWIEEKKCKDKEEKKALYVDYIMEKVAVAQAAGWRSGSFANSPNSTDTSGAFRSGNFKAVPEPKKEERKPEQRTVYVYSKPADTQKKVDRTETAKAVAGAGASAANAYVEANRYKYLVKGSRWFSDLPSSAQKEISSSGYIDRLNRHLPESLSHEDRARLIVRDLKRIYNEDIHNDFKELDRKHSDIRSSQEYSDAFAKLKGRKIGAGVGALAGAGIGALAEGARIPAALAIGGTGALIGYLGGSASDHGSAFETARQKNKVSQKDLQAPGRKLQESYLNYVKY